jgi:hypothetical protein
MREANRMTSIKTLVAQGRYEVDHRLVADAVMARLFGVGGGGGLQSECSNPASSASASTKHASG